MFSISDKHGKIRSDFTDEELEQLDNSKSEALAAVITAARKSEVADENDKASNASVEDALDELNAAEQAIRDTQPPAPDRIDEVRRMSENHRRASMGLPSLPPVFFKPEKQLVAAVAKAEKALSAARQRAAQTSVEKKATLSVLADVLKAWQRLNTVENSRRDPRSPQKTKRILPQDRRR